MPFLLDEREAQIAAWIEELHPPGGVTSFGDIPGVVDFIRGITVTRDQSFNVTGVQIAAELGYRDDTLGSGEGAEHVVWALETLVRRGTLTRSEALAYIRQRFPEQRWQGGRWGDLLEPGNSQLLAENQALPDGDPDRQDELEQALDARAAAGDAPEFGAVNGSRGAVVDELPVEWDQFEAQQVVEGMAVRLSGSLESLRRGDRLYPSHSIDGQSIIPGTLPVSAVRPRELKGFVHALPGPDEAVEIHYTLSETVDRWSSDGVSRGPGRVWRVTTVNLPAQFRPNPGPRRYRLVFNGTRFSAWHIELVQHTPPIVQMYYGVVIAGIPTFGYPPSRVIAVEAIDAPVSYKTQFVAIPGLSGGAFDATLQERFVTLPPPFMVPFAATSSILEPEQDDIDGAEGMAVGLITGRRRDQVAQQLNSRQSTYGQRFRRDGDLPGLAMPHWKPVRPPTGVQAVRWNGLDTTPSYTMLFDTTMPGSETRLIEGLPFLMEDCDRLKMTDQTFSVVLDPQMTRTTALTTLQTWPGPAVWHAYGAQVVFSQDRDWSFDMIVQ